MCLWLLQLALFKLHCSRDICCLSCLQSVSVVDDVMNSFAVNRALNFFFQTLNVNLSLSCMYFMFVWAQLSLCSSSYSISNNCACDHSTILQNHCHPLQHVSLRIAYTAPAIKQVVYCRFLWMFSWLLTLISLRRKENRICSNSPKTPTHSYI